jgi:cellobiose transport system permease protein
MTRALINSFLVAGTITVSVVLFATLAGFAFAKLRFRGNRALLLVIISTMMVPTQLGIVPLYLLMAKFQLVGRLPAVIVPSMVSAFGVFYMTQYLRTAVPAALVEAARVDGCNTAKILWHVVRPAALPAASVLATLTFMTAWNDFFWPLVAVNPDDPTVQVALSSLASGFGADFSLTLTGALIATVPLLLAFGLLGRRIVTGMIRQPRDDGRTAAANFRRAPAKRRGPGNAVVPTAANPAVPGTLGSARSFPRHSAERGPHSRE